MTELQALNRRWTRNIVHRNPVESGGFLRQLAMAFLTADDDNQDILEDAVTNLRNKYPKYDIPEREF